MRSLNQIILLGEVKEKMESQLLKDNSLLQPIIVKTDYSYVDKHGKKQVFNEDHYAIAWNKLATTFSQYVNVGDIIMIIGRLQSRFWYEGPKLRHEQSILVEKYISIKEGEKSSKIYD